MLPLSQRRFVNRVTWEKLQEDGQFILAYEHHFVALRRREGHLEVNLGSRTHTWANLRISWHGAAALGQEDGDWQLNPSKAHCLFAIQARFAAHSREFQHLFVRACRTDLPGSSCLWT